MSILKIFAPKLSKNAIEALDDVRTWKERVLDPMPEFKAFIADPVIARCLKITKGGVEIKGGLLDPGFYMNFFAPIHRAWFVLLVRFSAENNRAALLEIADQAPTDSAAIWAMHPPSCEVCGAVLPAHESGCHGTKP